MKRVLLLFLAAIACLCSCEKQVQSDWLPNVLSGTFDITMTNNDTGESEQHIATISLRFSDDRSECVVEKGVQVLQTVTRETYKAYLNDNEKIFVLNEGVYDSRILYMGELTSDGKVTLTWYTEEEMISVELIAEN